LGFGWGNSWKDKKIIFHIDLIDFKSLFGLTLFKINFVEREAMTKNKRKLMPFILAIVDLNVDLLCNHNPNFVSFNWKVTFVQIVKQKLGFYGMSLFLIKR
jgi:hypothetical protein